VKVVKQTLGGSIFADAWVISQLGEQPIGEFFAQFHAPLVE
jgi:hypothetical protein